MVLKNYGEKYKNKSGIVFFFLLIVHAGIQLRRCYFQLMVLIMCIIINYWVKHRPTDTDGQVNELKNIEEMKEF